MHNYSTFNARPLYQFNGDAGQGVSFHKCLQFETKIGIILNFMVYFTYLIYGTKFLVQPHREYVHRLFCNQF